MQVAVFRFEPGGPTLRGHPGHPQIFAILDGSGEVSGANGDDEPIEAGEAVFLAPGRGTRDEVSGWIDRAHHRGRTSGSFPRAPDGCSFALTPEAAPIAAAQVEVAKWAAKPRPPRATPRGIGVPGTPLRYAPALLHGGLRGLLVWLIQAESAWLHGFEWACLDSNQGPTDYELEAAISVGLGLSGKIAANQRNGGRGRLIRLATSRPVSLPPCYHAHRLRASLSETLIQPHDAGYHFC